MLLQSRTLLFYFLSYFFSEHALNFTTNCYNSGLHVQNFSNDNNLSFVLMRIIFHPTLITYSTSDFQRELRWITVFKSSES